MLGVRGASMGGRGSHTGHQWTLPITGTVSCHCNRQGQWQPLAATGQQLNVLRARATSGSQCLRPATALARSTFSVVVVRLARPTERTVSQRNRSFMCLSYSP